MFGYFYLVQKKRIDDAWGKPFWQPCNLCCGTGRWEAPSYTGYNTETCFYRDAGWYEKNSITNRIRRSNAKR